MNAALRRGGGAKRILALTDSVGSAGIAADVLTSERDDLLRSGVWNFAITRIKLGQLSTAPAFGWTYAYSLPSDCERVVSVHDNADGTGVVPYKVESILQSDSSYINVIATDASDIYLRYCRQITDPNLMTASFRQVLILRMAKIFAISIAKSNPLFAALDQEEQRAYRQARSIDGIEDYPERLPEGSWASSRRSRNWQRDNSTWPLR
ncbi:hypothetical protein [Bradyrhizobium sp. 62]|uniref:hypothetical protein n=1 Tax=Bradyrhizobium sp. 62 TaxID=1043588 RepID=UPI001FF99CDF|nr:hypothetical protein [Bradyrhizobium sp. 62]MCK1367621.1 hypothetical protein [Bradyrhizobium sp. 62]